MTIDLLQEALSSSWSRETAYRTDQPFWSEADKTRGQCTVTTMIIHAFLGGEMYRGFSKKYNVFHYWNVIDGKKIDLTFNQFMHDKADIKFDRIVTKTHDELMKIGNVRRRYLLLKQKVDTYLSEK